MAAGDESMGAEATGGGTGQLIHLSTRIMSHYSLEVRGQDPSLAAELARVWEQTRPRGTSVTAKGERSVAIDVDPTKEPTTEAQRSPAVGAPVGRLWRKVFGKPR